MGVEEILNQVTVAGISIVVLLVVSMELVKAIFHIEDRIAVLATVVLGVFYSYLAALARMYPVVETWAAPLAIGIVAAAAASGVYSWVKKRPPER